MIKARLWIEDFGYTKKLLIIKKNMDGSSEVFSPMEFKKLKKHSLATPFLENTLDNEDIVKDFMQAICDEAWENGIYPCQLADKKDELAATKYHLEDMRTLVLKDKI